MKALPKRKGNPEPTRAKTTAWWRLNESPSEKEGKSIPYEDAVLPLTSPQ